MKRTIFLPILAIFSSLMVTGCFTDKSSLDSDKFDEVKIASGSIPEIIRVEYLENISLTPLIDPGNADISDFSFKWEINQAPGSTEMVTLSTERTLNATITNKIVSSAYALIFTVKDEKHGVEYRKAWPVYVSSSFREGIVVADTKDGNSSDFNLIMDDNLTTSYNKGQNIKYGIWKTSTGSTHPALIKSITYALHKPTSILTKNVITAIYQNKEIEMYNCEDYSLYKNTEQIFPAKTASFDPQAFYTINNGYWILIANNIIYGFPSNQGITSFMVQASGTNYVDNAIVVPDNTNGAGPFAFWYNNNTGRIYNITAAYSTPMGGGEYTTQGSFNPGALPDRRIIAADISIDGATPAFLLKNNSTSNYELYAISFGYYDVNWNLIPSTPRLKADLPVALTSIINSAVSIFFASNDPVMYVVTPSKVYAILYGGGIVSYSEVYTAASGEQISKGKLFIQGRYRLNKGDFNSTSGPIYEAPLALNTKAIVLTTQSSEYAGNVYVIPITNTTTGTLNTASAKKYTGFGKIIDFTFQGQ
jgi:hypothetical protein